MRKLLLEFFLLIACTICQAQQFVKVESLDDVHEGIDYVLVCESQELGYATYNASKKALATIPITISNNSISDATGLAKIHLQATDGAWLMLDVTTNHYIGATNKNTDLEYVTGSGRKPLLKWTLQGDSIIHVNTRRYLAYNGDEELPLFKAYAQMNHSPVTLYVNAAQATGIMAYPDNKEQKHSSKTCYTLTGQKLINTSALPKGIYIINGRKTAIR